MLQCYKNDRADAINPVNKFYLDCETYMILNCGLGVG